MKYLCNNLFPPFIIHEGGVSIHDAPNKAEEKELLD